MIGWRGEDPWKKAFQKHVAAPAPAPTPPPCLRLRPPFKHRPPPREPRLLVAEPVSPSLILTPSRSQATDRASNSFQPPSAPLPPSPLVIIVGSELPDTGSIASSRRRVAGGHVLRRAALGLGLALIVGPRRRHRAGRIGGASSGCHPDLLRLPAPRLVAAGSGPSATGSGPRVPRDRSGLKAAAPPGFQATLPQARWSPPPIAPTSLVDRSGPPATRFG
jgi:hypothetical protein